MVKLSVSYSYINLGCSKGECRTLLDSMLNLVINIHSRLFQISAVSVASYFYSHGCTCFTTKVFMEVNGSCINIDSWPLQLLALSVTSYFYFIVIFYS